MILNILRFLFLALVTAVAMAYLSLNVGNGVWPWVAMFSAVVVAIGVILADFLFKKKNLTAMSGLFFGVLVGILVSLALGYLIQQVADIFIKSDTAHLNQSVITGLKLLMGLICCYVSVSFILQTRDDFRFIIPYVEFSRAMRGSRPFILDTSVIIDGRIADIAATGVFESRLIVPRFVLNELQTVADSGDKLKRGRGRRGLDVLQRLQSLGKLELHIWDGTLRASGLQGVDQKLLALTQQENGRLVTNDYNLNKIATLQGLPVININDLANALKPAALPGEMMRLKIVKPGEGPAQGVGYLEDGTMVVVEGARERVGQEIDLLVTNAVQTSAGRMIFGRLESTNGVHRGEPAARPEPSVK